MEIFYALTSIVLVLLGFIGCVVPVIPGPAIAYGGILMMLPSRFAPTTSVCVALGVACVVVTLLDFVVPAYGAKRFSCSRLGVVGCTIGTVVGIFFMPWGVILGPFIGAVLGELASGKRFRSSLSGGFGALLGFLCGILFKLVYCAVCAGWLAMALLGGLLQ